MKYFKISLLMSVALTTLQTIPMEQTPPIPPVRTSSMPGWTATTPTTTPNSEFTWQTALTEVGNESEPAIPPRPASFKQPGKPARPRVFGESPLRMQSTPELASENFTKPIIAHTFDSTQPAYRMPSAPVLQTNYPETTQVTPATIDSVLYPSVTTDQKPQQRPNVQLTKEQEHSLQMIEKDIHDIIDNLIDIASHGANLGIAAASSQGNQILGSVFTEGGPILKDVGATGLLIANIVKHTDRLSQASPEVREAARDRIHAIMHSEKFITAVAKFQTFATNPHVPVIIRSPLYKLSVKISTLPNSIARKLVK